MSQVIGSVAKRGQVKLAQPCRLGERHDAEAVGAAEARAKIVQRDADTAVIEVTCACGKRTYVTCQLAKEKS
jgi:hypothetical protein